MHSIRQGEPSGTIVKKSCWKAIINWEVEQKPY